MGSFDRRVYAFDATTGLRLWMAATGALVRSSPAVVDGKVYVGSFDKQLYAFGLPD